MRYLMIIGLFIGAAQVQAQSTAAEQGFRAERAAHKTKLTKTLRDDDTFPAPPKNARNVHVEIVDFPTGIGPMKAMVTKPKSPSAPKKKTPKKTKRAAIVWLTGGFPVGGQDEDAWLPQESRNDQSAQAFRLKGMVMMYPTLRGTFGNPGFQESFLGEVDDVIAAGKYLRSRPDVDPTRVYLGGHSTGGTLALLVAASTDIFAGVLAFGPVAWAHGYGADSMTFDIKVEKECEVRAPIKALDAIRTPTIVLEGELGNSDSVRALKKASRNANLKFQVVKRGNHFDYLAAINEHIGEKLAAGRAFEFSEKALQEIHDKASASRRESNLLYDLGHYRGEGIDFSKRQFLEVVLWSQSKANIDRALLDVVAQKFKVGKIKKGQSKDGRDDFEVKVHKKVSLRSLASFFKTMAFFDDLKYLHRVFIDDWSIATAIK